VWNQFNERRSAVIGAGLAVISPSLALAARPTLTLATGALPPLTSAPGHVGFLDALAQEIFNRVGTDATVVRLPVERALINANAGIEDGDMFRAAGFEKDYPNLVQVPEKVLDFDFVAYATRADVQVREWNDLARYSVGYVTGWKLYERNARIARDITTVRALDQLFQLLAAGRADVVLLDRWQGLWLAREAGLAVRPLDPPLARAEMFIYLHRRHAALVRPLAGALAAVKSDGTWQRLFDRILKPLEPAR
jgi:polar amino acid transport system substrate-binding protein